MRKNNIATKLKLLIIVMLLGINTITSTNFGPLPAHTDQIYAKQRTRVTKRIKKTKDKTKIYQKSSSINKISDAYSIIDKYHWSNAKATVYLNLQDNYLIDAAKQAVNNWNDTGAFYFTITNQRDQADIVISQIYADNTPYAGYTVIHYYVNSGLLFSVNSELNTYYLDPNAKTKFSQRRVINTVEHELGHAIGLQHTKHQSVMYPSGCYYSIQKEDIRNVKQLYHIN